MESDAATLIERLRAVGTRVGPRDAAFLCALADILEHRAIDPAYSQTAVDVIASITADVARRC